MPFGKGGGSLQPPYSRSPGTPSATNKGLICPDNLGERAWFVATPLFSIPGYAISNEQRAHLARCPSGKGLVRCNPLIPDPRERHQQRTRCSSVPITSGKG